MVRPRVHREVAPLEAIGVGSVIVSSPGRYRGRVIPRAETSDALGG